jgi:hypothetical protein
MIKNIVLPIILLLFVYAGLVAGLTWAFSRLPRLARWRFLAGILCFGLLTSLLAVWIWPLDSSVYANLFSVLLGDVLYNQATNWFGPADPAQAHLAVPWLLRVPQIYLTVSLPLYGLLGLVCQLIDDRRAAPGS